VLEPDWPLPGVREALTVSRPNGCASFRTALAADEGVAELLPAV
jgi:hypothetical protein